MNSSTPERISKWLQTWLLSEQIHEKPVIEPLAGDGSTRCFYRVRWGGQTGILLSDPEWIFSKDYAAHQAYLTACKIPVPRFFSVDPAAGFLIMEDLGDDLLQFHLQRHPAEKMRGLTDAVELLAKFHGATFPVPATLPASERRFDKTKYWEELRFTQTHLNEKLLGLPPLNASAAAQLEAFCTQLAQIEPIALSHRDYHTRNLLVKADRLCVIDFQDARLGPPHYDLASILYDAYLPVTDDERATLLAKYKTTLSKFPKLYEKISWDQWDRDLSWVAFQRVVKAAGSFASFFTRNGKRTHLPYLIPAIEFARSLQGRYPEIARVVGDGVKLDTWISKIKAGQWDK